jgi:hypothetical protein
MAEIEDRSFRIGVVASLAVRLYEPRVEKDKDLRPTVGPSAVEPGSPMLVVYGQPGTETYQRVWSVSVPKKGASPVALASAGDSRLSGFEAEPAVPGGAPPSVLGPKGDRHVLFPTVLCRRVKLRLNNHRTADEAEIELPIEAFPFPADGSVVRSVLVEIRRGVISSDDWAEAMLGRRAADGRPLTVPLAVDTDDPDFVGFVDLHAITFGGGSSTVSLKARDFAGVLADSKTRGRKIEEHLPVDEAIARFLSTLPAAVGLSVVWHGPANPPTLGAAAPKAKLSKKGKPLARSTKTDKQSFLDAIADHCILAGVIPTFRGYSLHLAPARTLNQFTASTVPRMVLGRNIEKLSLEHRLAGANAVAVEVRSFDPDTGRVVLSRYPEDPNRHGEESEPGATHAQPPTGPLEIPPGTSGVDEKSPTVMVVYGVKDPERLREIARSIFEESAIQELSGKLETKDVSTIEGRFSGIADLLALRAGDPIQIVISPTIEDKAGSFVQRLGALAEDPAKAVELLRSVGYLPEVAEQIVDLVISNRRPLVYRVRDVSCDHSLDGATTTEVSFVNYIETAEEKREKGGHRREVALKGDATWAEKWAAIEADMQDGEIGPSEAEALKKQVGEAEIRSRIRPIREEF